LFANSRDAPRYVAREIAREMRSIDANESRSACIVSRLVIADTRRFAKQYCRLPIKWRSVIYMTDKIIIHYPIIQ